MKKIKHLILDVDGTLTDGKIYMSDSGELFKAFNIKDGYGLAHIARENDIEPIIITGRQSMILEQRCQELGITKVFQDIQDKEESLLRMMNTEMLGETACIGDDANDLSCMNRIKQYGGVIGCPADGIKEIKDIADYVCEKKGGEGAVREFIEWLVLRD